MSKVANGDLPVYICLGLTIVTSGTEYIEAIIAFFLFALCALCLPETYAPVLLKQKAQKLRKSTGDERYWHPHEKEKIDVHNVVTKHLARPLVYEATLDLQKIVLTHA